MTIPLLIGVALVALWVVGGMLRDIFCLLDFWQAAPDPRREDMQATKGKGS